MDISCIATKVVDEKYQYYQVKHSKTEIYLAWKMIKLECFINIRISYRTAPSTIWPIFSEIITNAKLQSCYKLKKLKDKKRKKDEGNLIKSNSWNPLFVKLIEKETNIKDLTWHQFVKRFCWHQVNRCDFNFIQIYCCKQFEKCVRTRRFICFWNWQIHK